MNKRNWLGPAILLGLAFFLAVFLVKPIGVSTQFSVFSGIIHNALDEDLIVEDETRDSGYRSTNEYYDKSEGKIAKNIVNPINYEFIFVLAIPLGAYIAYLIKRKKNKEEKIEKVKSIKQKFNLVEFIKKYSPSFAAGFLILFGARLADGCTSGHMMSGIMQGSVSGFIFTIAVFVVAIPVSILMSKKMIKKGEFN